MQHKSYMQAMTDHGTSANASTFGRLLRPLAPAQHAAPRLIALDGVKYNPGNLAARCYVPNNLAQAAPLVVVLHGCRQSAEDYDRGSGWSRLADRYGFALLFPEQKEANNALLCFNWFQAGDSQRGMGEPASIRAMIEAMRAAWTIDTHRIFVTGLSAGGAMASVMLATYPEIFEAGAIIAGIPYGCATGVREAFECMGGRANAQGEELAAKVRRASPHKGPWPRVSVWQGSDDLTVLPSNADALVLQWLELHGLPAKPSRRGRVEGYPHRIWVGCDGAIAVERYDITGMAHGTPLMPGTDAGQSGEAGAHMLDARISSTDRIAAFFGIAPKPPQRRKRPMPKTARPGALLPNPWDIFPRPSSLESVRKTLDDALRAARR
jgi:poly(hydroxyalkanoate) depolymerase family esterase